MKMHLVSFQVPYPANYGGVIDVYYKLKWLKEAGVEVMLHCFMYDGACPQTHLEELCSEVHYYERESGILKQLCLEPYIVSTRCSKQLLENLCKDNEPIFFDGIHTCHFLSHPRLKDRKKYVRMHNVEHEYYHLLACQDKTNWRSIYYQLEAWKLRRFEQKLSVAETVFAITEADTEELRNELPNCNVETLPCFYDDEFVSAEGGTRPYVLYQGNLRVEENVRVAHFIIKELAATMPDVQFVMAGRDPSFTCDLPNVEIIANPSEEKMADLLANARINLLITFQPTGIKLKLMSALIKSRGHVLANEEMLHSTGLNRLVVKAETSNSLRSNVYNLLKQGPSVEELTNRQAEIKKKKAGISRLSLFK